MKCLLIIGAVLGLIVMLIFIYSAMIIANEADRQIEEYYKDKLIPQQEEQNKLEEKDND